MAADRPVVMHWAPPRGRSPLGKPETPWLEWHGAQAYAYMPQARVRFRVVTQKYVPLDYRNDWGFDAVPVRAKHRIFPKRPVDPDDQHEMTRRYRKLVDDAMKEPPIEQPKREYPWTRLYADGSSELQYADGRIVKQGTLDDRKIMRDWPDSQIGNEAWHRELRRRKEGQQPAMFWRAWTDEEIMARGGRVYTPGKVG